jgi:hypothetical protein
MSDEVPFFAISLAKPTGPITATVRFGMQPGRSEWHITLAIALLEPQAD